MKTRHVLGLAGLGTTIYILVVKGAVTLDVGLGRRTRPLGPIHMEVAAPPEVVFDVIAAPYLGTTPQAMEEKLHVLERGTDMVLAEHFTDVGAGLRTTTVEVVCFERPLRISFRLVRGPVPHVTEAFELEPSNGATQFTYTGEMGADFWGLGQWWSNQVARKWEKAVEVSLAGVKEEAERRAVRTRTASRTRASTPADSAKATTSQAKGGSDKKSSSSRSSRVTTSRRVTKKSTPSSDS